jgi:hypothetical protein
LGQAAGTQAREQYQPGGDVGQHGGHRDADAPFGQQRGGVGQETEQSVRHLLRWPAAGQQAAERFSALQELAGQQGETLAAQQNSKGSSGHKQCAGAAVSHDHWYSTGLAGHRDGQQGDDRQA